MSTRVTLTQEEYEALHYAVDFIGNVVESCSDEENASEIIKQISLLQKIILKAKKNKS